MQKCDEVSKSSVVSGARDDSVPPALGLPPTIVETWPLPHSAHCLTFYCLCYRLGHLRRLRLYQGLSGARNKHTPCHRPWSRKHFIPPSSVILRVLWTPIGHVPRLIHLPLPDIPPSWFFQALETLAAGTFLLSWSCQLFIVCLLNHSTSFLKYLLWSVPTVFPRK